MPMLKVCINFIVFFLLFTSSVFANNEELKLQKKYGNDLACAPFFLRFDYLKKFGKDWDSTSYPERKEFLLDFEHDTKAEQDKMRDEAKAEAEKQKERLREKKDELRKKKALIKAQLESEKAQRLADELRQKQMDEADKEQRRELHDLEQQVMK